MEIVQIVEEAGVEDHIVEALPPPPLKKFRADTAPDTLGEWILFDRKQPYGDNVISQDTAGT